MGRLAIGAQRSTPAGAVGYDGGHGAPRNPPPCLGPARPQAAPRPERVAGSPAPQAPRGGRPGPDRPGAPGDPRLGRGARPRVQEPLPAGRGPQRRDPRARVATRPGCSGCSSRSRASSRACAPSWARVLRPSCGSGSAPSSWRERPRRLAGTRNSDSLQVSLGGELHAADPAHERPDRELRLEPRQVRAEAEVLAAAEAPVRDTAACHVEAVGIGEGARVAVGCAEQRQHGRVDRQSLAVPVALFVQQPDGAEVIRAGPRFPAPRSRALQAGAAGARRPR